MGKEYKPSQAMHFDRGLVGDTASLKDLPQGTLDQSLRSNMDMGEDEDAFNEADRTESNLDGIRESLLVRMRNENEASRADADKMETEHIKYTADTMNPLIDEVKKAKKEAIMAEADYYLTLSKLGGTKSKVAVRQMNALATAALRSLTADRAQPDARNQQPVPERDAVVNVFGAFAMPGNAGEDDEDFEALGIHPVEEDEEGEAADAPAPDLAADAAPAANPVAPDAPAPPVPPAPPAPPASPAPEPIAAITQDSVKDQSADYDKLLGILQKTIDNRAKNKGRIRRFFASIIHDEESALVGKEAKKQKAASEADKLQGRLEAASARWNERRKKYRDTTYSDHYRKYDDLAISFYRFTREYGDLPGGRNLSTLSYILDRGTAAKNIAEYTGIYDETQFGTVGAWIQNNPYVKVSLKRKKARELSADSLNAERADGLIKYHKTILMEAFAEGVTTLAEEARAGKAKQRVRMKLTEDFRGYKAKNQYDENSATGLAPLQDDPAHPRSKYKRSDMGDLDNPVGIDVSDMHVLSDERGANGKLIYSENSAHIYEVTLSGGRKVKGFFDNGTFIPFDHRQVVDNKDIKLIYGLKDLFSSGKVVNSIDNMSIQEELRAAIRRSDLFRHINSGMIQRYVSYDPDDDFKRDENNAKAAAIQGIVGDAARLVDGYIAYKNDNTQPQVTLQSVRTAVFNAARNNDRENLMLLGVRLLSDDQSPELWSLAREFSLQIPGGGFDGSARFAARAKRLPEAGSLMRMGLLKEFTTKRKYISELGVKDIPDMLPGALDTDTVMQYITPDELAIAGEDYAAERDDFLSWKNLRQSFFDGSLREALFGNFSATAKTVKAYATDEKKIIENKLSKIEPIKPEESASEEKKKHYDEIIEKLKEDPNYNDLKRREANAEKRAAEAKIVSDYSSLVASAESLPEAIAVNVPTITVLALSDWDFESDSVEMNYSALGILQGTRTFVKDLVKFIRDLSDRINEWDPENNIYEKVWEVASIIIMVLENVVRLLGDFLDIIGAAIKYDGSADQDVFDKTSGIVALLKDVLRFIKDAVDIASLGIERYKITTSKEDILSAMAETKNNAPNLQRALVDGDFGTTREKMGHASFRNSQGLYFLMLAHNRAERGQITTGFDMASTTVKAVGHGFALDSDNVNTDLRAVPFTLISKIVSFLGWKAGKEYDDIKYFEMMDSAIGRAYKTDTKKFDRVLRDETGIMNHHYLPDLLKIFMAIDTHHLVRNARNEGEQALAINLVSPYIKSMNGKGAERYDAQRLGTNTQQIVRKVKLKKMLEAVGAPKNWRDVLRASVTAT